MPKKGTQIGIPKPNGGRPKGVPNRCTQELRDIMLSRPDGFNPILTPLDWAAQGWRPYTDPDTGRTEKIRLSEKAIMACCDRAADRMYSRLNPITLEKGEEESGDNSPVKVQIEVVNCRKTIPED
jgi:hypothetical protein